MNKFKYIVLTLLATAAVPLSAQRLHPVRSHIDCGQILYNKPYTVKFEVETEGKHYISIDSIESSCECVQTMVPPGIRGGKSFTVSAIFDARQLGHFDKYLLIYTDAQKEPLELTFSGIVKAEVKDFTRYPYEINGLLTDAEELEFDDVNKGDVLHKIIHVANAGNTTVEPNIMHLPSYLNAEAIPEKLKPESTGIIKITLDSKTVYDYGLTQTNVYLGKKIGEKIAPEKALPVSVVVLPPTETLTEAQRLNAPHIKLSTDTLDLGSFDGRSKKSGTVKITNTGKSALSLKSLQLFTPGIQIKLNKQRIEPGEEAKLKITAVKDLLSKKKSIKPRILMITDDPDKSKIIIHIKIK